MSDSVQDCIDRLRDLAQTSTSDYRIAAGQIVSDFNAQAGGADREKLKRRLGGVDGFDQDKHAGEGDEGGEVLGGLLAA